MTWDDFCYKMWQKYVQNNIFQCLSALKSLCDMFVWRAVFCARPLVWFVSHQALWLFPVTHMCGDSRRFSLPVPTVELHIGTGWILPKKRNMFGGKTHQGRTLRSVQQKQPMIITNWMTVLYMTFAVTAFCPGTSKKGRRNWGHILGPIPSREGFVRHSVKCAKPHTKKSALHKFLPQQAQKEFNSAWTLLRVPWKQIQENNLRMKHGRRDKDATSTMLHKQKDWTVAKIFNSIQQGGFFNCPSAQKRSPVPNSSRAWCCQNQAGSRFTAGRWDSWKTPSLFSVTEKATELMYSDRSLSQFKWAESAWTSLQKSTTNKIAQHFN